MTSELAPPGVIVMGRLGDPAIAALRQRLDVVPRQDGRPLVVEPDDDDIAWTVRVEGHSIAFGCAIPVPGLAGHYDLGGGVDPDWRRRGYGQWLLVRLIHDLAQQGARQLLFPVRQGDPGPAAFLSRQGWQADHEELTLQRPLAGVSPPPLPSGLQVTSFDLPTARTQLQELYDNAFAGQPWRQPFTDAELAATLIDPTDVHFLTVDGRTVGAAWLRPLPTAPAMAEIEPLGIAAHARRRGYGRLLLQASLAALATWGVRRAQVVVWQANEPARRLYEQAGFEEVERVVYWRWPQVGGAVNGR